MIFIASFSKFSDLLPAFTCASAIGNIEAFFSEFRHLFWAAYGSRPYLKYSEVHLLVFFMEIFLFQKHEEIFVFI